MQSEQDRNIALVVASRLLLTNGKNWDFIAGNESADEQDAKLMFERSRYQAQRELLYRPREQFLSVRESRRSCEHGMLIHGSGLKCIHGCK